MTDFIGINVAGLEEIKEISANVVPEAIDAGVEEANAYIVDVEHLYPPRVQHGAENPYQWDSDKQRRAYFATNGFGGGIPYQRTQTLANGWKTEGSGINQIVVNEVPYAAYVKDFQQSRGHMYDGWDIIQTDLLDRIDRIVEKFEAGTNRILHKLGLD